MMTREEAMVHTLVKENDELNMEIGRLRQALEQEPCEDAVSRANLLKEFEDRFVELQKAHQKEMQLGVNWCINTLKDMPSVTPTRKKWIPVSERLPEEDTDVLITNGIGIYVGWFDGDRNKWLTDHNTMDGIVAWMPLPNPYGEREGREE